MDAGSSHTTLYVYKWNGEKLNNTALAKQVDYCKVPGSFNSHDFYVYFIICIIVLQNIFCNFLY